MLLLDEPMGGMNQEEKEDIARFILDINSEWDTTIILIEHDMAWSWIFPTELRSSTTDERSPKVVPRKCSNTPRC